MKNLAKYICLLSLFLAVACSNPDTTKESKVAAATTLPTEPIAKERMATTDAETTMEATVKEEEKIEKEPMAKKVIEKEVVPQKASEKKLPTEKKMTTKKETLSQQPITTAPRKEKPLNTKKEAVDLEQVTEKEETIIKEKEPAKRDATVTTPKANVPTTTPKTMEPKAEVVPIKPAAFSHDAWNTLAQKHISSTGKVNYKGFQSDIAAFDAYLKSLADNPVQDSWSRSKKMAYWINAYNAFTIKLIVDNYPVKSITDLDGGKPWDKKWIKLGGKTYSLNNIEHDILRPQFKDARIHFAVNCAAKSCPPVWNKAWTAQNLEGQLTRSAKSFINNEKYNDINSGKVAISKIFDWYKEDFGNITDYLNKYATTKINDNTSVNYKAYNWALNE
ncbi:MAG: DUF547 domain-containing protein [Bacteroidota bacterium]